jgi:SpoVK/Ycf46/Vps4 family AAA+-type ATPase
MPTGWEKQLPPQNKIRETESEPLMDRASERSNDETTEMGRMEMFIPEYPYRSLEDLIVPSSVRARIETALNRIRYHDELYNEWNLKKVDPHGTRIAINLFGPPGTGKTLCAEVIAHYLGKKIIRVNYAEIESKYVGETPKNITAAFKKARETDSVLFFDEADSILGKRLTHVIQSADHGVNVSRSTMLLQLDKFDGIVLFATNLARNYDGAFIRRILAHIEFELPDEGCRIRLWKHLLPAEVPIANDITAEWLATESDGLAGGDILNVVVASASQAVQRSGDFRCISRADVREEIYHVRIAREKIGSSIIKEGKSSLTEKVIHPGELPPDARERYEKTISRMDHSTNQASDKSSEQTE